MNRTASKFIKSLYKILSNSTLESIICWTTDGSKFIIKDLLEFEQRILSNYFPDINIKKFRKKLKMLLFTKTVTNDTITFSHAYFQKNKPYLLGKICCFSEIPSRKKVNFSSDMAVKIRLLESAHIRMEETVADLEKKYQKIIDFNKFMLKELNQHTVNSEYDTEHFKKLMNKSNPD
ncbi:hypothetical protein SteCoe_12019 [Stentor coeruleus]|uniref:HSF-type DNA-binding domain-containing protein n=1 Tax=Stentor coeruleus TaxID=5963 RepID=A0A1R2CBU6_9CILI|nr:hypothetical protein SteCoe_12019 [Stentor coeruleus]